MEDCKLKNSAFDIKNDFTMIPYNVGKFYQQTIDFTVELKVYILILDGNQLWIYNSDEATFKDKKGDWQSPDMWNLKETTDDDETFTYIEKDGNIHKKKWHTELVCTFEPKADRAGRLRT